MSPVSKKIVRKIIHIDMDCFFAAVEMRENPNLKGQPVAVGGKPGARSVVAACSYEARKFGVHSAMPTSQALQKCPKLICLPVRMNLYKNISVEINKIYQKYTQLIEPLSLDEVFLDVSECKKFKNSATLIAKQIRQDIYQSQKLTASAGIAPNKLLAKIASDWNKPNGQLVITPDKVENFMKTLAVNKIFGVGKVTTKKMHQLGIKTCLDLQNYSVFELQKIFGQFGVKLYELSRGIDERNVSPYRLRKSLSVEDTFANDLPNLKSSEFALLSLHQKLIKRLKHLQQKQDLPIQNLFIKLRFKDFKTTTAQSASNIIELSTYKNLLKTAWLRQKKPVRLIGLGVRFKHNQPHSQIPLL